ncbi:amino acid adenylation domain-containing protein [Actinomadura logoneensis]|uniref:Amino acid adenylation domain-containing protein n=1 Tax=Actinomadura logoneensis TaxID=2293572 RepID=A0A372JJ54_9ACTN|nr:non-ribosomal peptide synthetase/MFS transporter [Actinomadura logoneensis]RFU40052.1 amino acid adenylation domain-containing protein [Actinomadura logoneensis]
MTEVSQDRVRELLGRRIAAARRPEAGIPRGAGDGRLSPVQRRMWLAGAAEPDNPSYNVPVVLRLRGRLDVPALEAALADLAARHDVLHSRIVAGDDGPRAVPGGAPSVAHLRADAAELDARLTELVHRPFRLAEEIPFRPTLLRVGDEDHVLALVVHHLAVDAGSLPLLVDELAALYRHRTGDGPALDPPPLRYGDAAAWLDARAESPAAERALEWWTDRLAGLDPAPVLAPVPRTGWTGAELDLDLDEATVAAVRDLARGGSVFMVLLAALQVLLARLGDPDVAVGVPEAGRRHPDLESVMGCFIETLVVRDRVDLDATGRELVRRARAAALDAVGHAEVPFDRVAERVAPGRPLFGTLLNVVAPPPAPRGFPGLSAEFVEIPMTAVKTALTWTFIEDGAELRGRLAYRADLYDTETARRLAGWFTALLRGLAADPDRPAGSLPLEPGADHVLAAPAAARDPRAVHERFLDQARRVPDARAVVASDGVLTYAELADRSRRLAGRLRALGVGRGDHVGVLMERTRDLPVALLGVLMAGAAYVPVDETAPPARVARLLSGTGTCVVSPSLADRVPSGPTVLSVDDVPATDGTAQDTESEGTDTDGTEVAVSSSDPAYVIFTSGSTGTPKQVVVSHGNLTAYLDAVATRIGGSSSYALVSTIAADLGLMNVFGALTTGAALHLLELAASTDPAVFAERVRGVETFKCVPSHLEGLAAHAPLDSLLPGRLLVLAGEAVPWTLVDRVAQARPDLEVQVHYGPTETTVSVLGCVARDVARGSANVPLGTPFPGVSCFVADAAGRPVPHGVPGELWIGGPQVARGEWHRSGDRARVRPDGTVEFLGRIDDQVKVRGHRVDPGEVAAACRAVPGVAEAVVLGVPDGLAAWLVAPGADEATVRRELRRTLPDAMVPSSFTFLDALPLTVNGKIDRGRLPDPVRAVRAAGVPSSAAELLVAEVWEEVLGVPGAGPGDDFFAFGGDSFSAVRAAAAFAERSGTAVPPRLLFDHPVLADLARELESLTGGAEEPIPPRAGTGPWPLTPLQRRLWLAAEMDPESSAYNVPVLLRLRGDLDVPALRAAVSGLARRHEMLRTRVVLQDGEPHGITDDPAEVPLPVEPVDDLDARLAELTSRPFALAGEPPFRATLLALGPDEHVLVLVLHHIASDARSRAVLLRDLAALYSGRSLEPLGVGFADIAAWQHGRPASTWWTEHLADLPPELDLPCDRAREDGAGAGFLRLELGDELVAGVRGLAADAGATVFMVLLTALQTTLARVSGGEDVAVAVPEAGRRHRDAEDVVGCLLDTLVVRTRLDGATTGRALLGRIRGDVLDAFAHAAEPFEPPPLQVLLNLYPAPGAVTGFDGLAVEALETLPTTARFDLSWTVQDDGTGLRGGLTYRRDLFDDGTARRLAGFFTAVLSQLVAAPDAPLDGIVLEPGADPVLTGPPASPGDGPTGLHERIERRAAATPDATAVAASDGTYSYAELDGRAGALAAHLRATGVGRGDRVAVLLPRSRDLPVALLGVLKARAAFVPLDDAAPADRIAAMCATAGVRVAVTAADLAGHLPRDVAPVVLADLPPLGETDAADGSGGEERTGEVAADDLAYVIFTSGSTGTPKGVAVEHGGFAAYLDGVLPRVGTHRSWALVSTIAADLGMLNVFGALTTGGALHLFDRDTAADPEAFAARIRGVDFLKCVPSHLELLASHGDLASVLPERLLVLAGEAVPWTLVDLIAEARPELEVQAHYGPTETTVAVLTCTAREEERTGPNVPLGRPLPGVRCVVADARGRPRPHGLAGELWIGGPQVARGYLGADGFGEYYRSGDRVRVRPDGVVEFLGRIDDQVKIRGYRVEPGEVAAVCRTLPGVTAAAVLAVGTGSARRLAAWLVADGLDAAEARAALRSLLPDYMVPSTITFLPELPLNPNGKVDRARLPLDAPETDFAEPETEAEKRIAAIWADLLDLERVGADDDFFALGGDSFLAVKAVQAIDPALRVIDLVTHPTVRELAATLGTAGEAGLLHRLSGPRQGTATATIVCVPYGGGSAAVYRPLAEALPEGTEVLALELPGHDPARPDEPMRPLEEVVEQCVAELATRTTGPIAVYGHCVGSALATALALRLEETGVEVTGVHVGGSFPTARLPGRLSAWFNRRLPADRWLSDRAYRDVLRSMGGLPEDLEGAAVETAVRAIRHDARQAQDWFTRRLADPRRLRAPIQVIVGESDGATDLYQERYREWEAFSPDVSLAVVPLAGHYFLRHQPEVLASFLADPASARETAPPEAGPASPDAATPPPLAKGGLRGFHIVAAGQLASMVGSSLSSFALGVWTFQRSGRVLDFALVTMLALLPAVLAGPLGGAVADRYDRRRVMFACDGVSGLAMAAAAVLLWRDGLTFAAVCGIVTLLSVVSAFHRPAYLAAVAQLVPKPYLPQANALAQAGLGLGTLVAPLAGGALIGLAGLPTVVAVDVGTFVLALLTLAAVPFPDRMFRRREETFRSALAGGWRFITRRPPLLVMAVYFMGVNYFTALTLAVVSPMVLARDGAVQLGVVTAAGGLGAVLGSLLMMRWGGMRRLADGMVGFVAVAGVATVVTGLAGVLAVVPLVAFGLALRWGSTSVINAHWLAIIQLKVRMELQGRVLATNQMLATAMTPLGYLSTAPLAAGVGAATGAGRAASLGWLLAGMGVLLTVWGVAGLRLRRLRHIEDLLPDALPTAETSRDLDELQEEADRSLSADRP